MEIQKAYVSYGEYFLDFDSKSFTFELGFEKPQLKGKIASEILNGYSESEIKYELKNDGIVKTVSYKNGKDILVVTLTANKDGVGIQTCPQADVEAYFCNASTENLNSMRLKKRSSVINCSLGNAASLYDNAVFDKQTDTAAVISSSKAHIGFDNEKNLYTLHGKCDFCFEYVTDIYKNEFKINYAPINKNNTFGNLPPVGWMSWYAVKFDASEKTVTDNAVFQSEHLRDFGANTVWVDWEWYHKGFDEESVRDDGVDTFNIDKTKYPNGLKVVSDKIRELGFIPSLWIGFTNETFENDYIKEHPEVLLAVEQSWVGTYFYDITHPTYLNDYLPKALSQVDKWGYEAVKFDTLPICMERTEAYHERLYDKSVTTHKAYRNMIARTREILGKDRYMLSCAGDKKSDVLWAADIFDAARIGLDIFKWEEFIDNCVYRTMEFYPVHNIMMYNDPDNVVIRDEFNTMDQAVSRATFVSLLGMPITFGDNLPDLQEERVEILKRIIPALDIKPKDIEAKVIKEDILVTNLNINKDWENYNVVSVFNTTEDNKKYYLDFGNTCELSDEEYHIYDFWHGEYLGMYKEGIHLNLKPCETRLLSVRKAVSTPQVVSTSRHITQGALEIEKLEFANKTLSMECNLVANDLYRVSLYVPDGYAIADAGKFEVVSFQNNVAVLEFVPTKTDKYSFKIEF